MKTFPVLCYYHTDPPLCPLFLCRPRQTASLCTELQAKVLQCYRENPQQTLHCSSLAKQYMACVQQAKVGVSHILFVGGMKTTLVFLDGIFMCRSVCVALLVCECLHVTGKDTLLCFQSILHFHCYLVFSPLSLFAHSLWVAHFARVLGVAPFPLKINVLIYFQFFF